MTENPNNNTIIRFCKVLKVEGGELGYSEYGGLRIKVRLEPEDGDILEDDKLPFVFPLLPKMLHVNPKVGETVMVILANTDSPKGHRFFVGPVISQPYFMNMAHHDTSAMALLNGRQIVDPLPNPQNFAGSEGALPKREDVAILGRLNSDIILKDSEIRMRVGSKKTPTAITPTERCKFNDVDMGYIQMRYENFANTKKSVVGGKTQTVKDNDFRSIINVVADRINLLSYDSPDYFEMNDTKELIKKEEVYKILQNAHPLIYGDDFMDFMKKLIDIFNRHTHPFSMKPPVLNAQDITVLSTNLDKFLSKSVRTN